MRNTWNLAIGAAAVAWTLCAHLPAAMAQDEEEDEADEAAQEEGMVESADLDASAPASGSIAGRGGWLTPGSIDVFGGFRLGLGGGVDFDPGGDDDLVATFGLSGGAEYVWLDYLALGAELRLAWLNSEAADDFGRDRLMLFDFVVRPRGRYVIESIGLEVYGTLPLGLTVPNIPDDQGAGDGTAGFTLGLGAGAIYFLTEHIAVNLEMLWLKHWFGSEVASGAGNLTTDYNVGQFNLVSNVVFVL